VPGDQVATCRHWHRHFRTHRVQCSRGLARMVAGSIGTISPS
jgi:hypothetical protein